MATISPATFEVGADGQWKAAQGTITAAKPAWNSSATWNNAAVTFTHMKADVTDTASAADSMLIDLRIAGLTKFSVTKAGAITAAAGVTATTGTFSGAVSMAELTATTGTFSGAVTLEAAGGLRQHFKNTGNRFWSLGNDGVDFTIKDESGAADKAKLRSATLTGTETALEIMGNNGTTTVLRQVLMGAADSGGAGFRMLRVANG